MRPQLYMLDICPSARSVVLTAQVLGITIEEVDVGKNQHFAQFNNKWIQQQQEHHIPILKDAGYVIWDGHSINAYLIGKYGIDDSLYPRDVNKRSIIDERLEFDSCVVSFFARTLLNPIVHEDINGINEIYGVVENFFDNDQEWVAGDSLTLADLSLLPSITSLDVAVPIDASKFPKVVKWIKRAQNLPFYEANQRGLYKLKEVLCSNT